MKDLIQKFYSPDDPPVGGGVSVDPIPADFEPAGEFKWEPQQPQDEMPAWARAIHERLDELTTRSTPQDESWRYDNEALALQLKQEIAAMRNQMSSEVAQLAAPMMRESVVTQLGSGLNDAGKEFIRKQIAKLAPAQLSGILNSQESVELLRNAAENAHNKSAKTPMPKAEPVDNPRTGTKSALNAEMEREKQRLMKSFKMTEEEATATIHAAMESR